ncbi:unannotated protein [freshwater metagenome]|uniref:Unannotated protein n=1 Tax=freshwater metagenome TaxID=449393 RepID=A0A6J6EFD4_9ZZZZ
MAGLLVGNGGPGGNSAAKDVRFKIFPLPRSRIPGTTAFMSTHGAQRLTCKFFSSSTGETSSNGVYPLAAALLTSMSTGPNSDSTRSTSVDRPPSGSARSTGSTKQVPPICSIRSRVSLRPATLRAVIATLAPSAASRSAIAVPVPPLLAPVTIAVIPAHSMRLIAGSVRQVGQWLRQRGAQ